MNAKRRIVLVGLTSLESIAVRELIHQRLDAKVERFQSVAGMRQDDERDAYVTSADSFVCNADFFLPRKQKTLVVTKDSGVVSGSNGVSVVSALSDETEIEKSISDLMDSMKDSDPQHGNLSAREVEVLKCIASGKINKEIADELCISINTVITHRKNISSKLGIKSASGLSLYAVMNGII